MVLDDRARRAIERMMRESGDYSAALRAINENSAAIERALQPATAKAMERLAKQALPASRLLSDLVTPELLAAIAPSQEAVNSLFANLRPGLFSAISEETLSAARDGLLTLKDATLGDDEVIVDQDQAEQLATAVAPAAFTLAASNKALFKGYVWVLTFIYVIDVSLRHPEVARWVGTDSVLSAAGVATLAMQASGVLWDFLSQSSSTD